MTIKSKYIVSYGFEPDIEDYENESDYLRDQEKTQMKTTTVVASSSDEARDIVYARYPGCSIGDVQELKKAFTKSPEQRILGEKYIRTAHSMHPSRTHKEPSYRRKR